MATYRVPGDPRIFQPVSRWPSIVVFSPISGVNSTRLWRYQTGRDVPSGRKLTEWSKEYGLRFIIDLDGLRGELCSVPGDVSVGSPEPEVAVRGDDGSYQVPGDPRWYVPAIDWARYIAFSTSSVSDCSSRSSYRSCAKIPRARTMIRWARVHSVRFIVDAEGLHCELIKVDRAGDAVEHPRQDRRWSKRYTVIG